MPIRPRLGALVAAGVLAATSVRAGDAPEWLLEAARTELPAYGAEVKAAVLLDSGHTLVESSGRRTRSQSVAIRILSRNGSDVARASAVYAPGSAKVRELRAWIVRPTGEVRRLGKDTVLDLALANNDVYNQARVRLVDASRDVQPGDIFGFESVVEEQAEFNQIEWTFQGRLPVRLSRFELVLPPGWTLEPTWFNHAPLAPQLAGATHAWELRDLPRIESEPGAPVASATVPRLALTLLPPAASAGELRSFATWQDVARWTSSLYDARAEPDAGVSARARELTAGLTDELSRIRAIARFVQRIPYISIQVGLGRFQPHPAAEILAKSYGDCKDKATLMRSLLGVAGIRSYPVLVSGSDPRFVRPEWPSPLQFDHVILAIRTESAAGSPAALSHPALGRLLLFDPTDEHTRLGDLPQSEQGGAALLAAGDSGSLLTIPTFPAEANQLSRRTEATLGADGRLSGHLVEDSVGQAAAEERRAWAGRTREEYVDVIERWLARGITGVQATRIEVRDGDEDGFHLEVDFATERYGQSMQGRLVIFKPALVSRRQWLHLTRTPRTQPVIVAPDAYDETARIALPPGFRVDELPAPLEQTTSFGDYALRIEADGDAVVLTRRLRTRAAVVPVEQYASVLDFYEKILAAEQSPVVLVRE